MEDAEVAEVIVYEAFAVCAPGLEPLVAEELAGLGLKNLKQVDGGIEFGASRRQLYEANLHLRTASRVIVRLAEFKALTFADLERRARRVPWEKVMAKAQAVTLRVTCRKSRLYHSGAVAERITRDLVERMNAEVSTTREDGETDASTGDAQLIVVRFDRDRCTISADSSGTHLHQRGYRTSVTQAPMRETLAAALVMAGGWDERSPLLDPFCGSGTIPIEAALIAAHIAPGRNRPFRFMRWPDFDAALWKQVLSEAHNRARVGTPAIVGSDRSAAALRAARENAERAGVAGMLQLEKADALQVSAEHDAGWIVSNPPYGVRLGDRAETQRLLGRFGQRLRDEFAGWQVAILAPAGSERLLGFSLESRLRTTNGGLRVQILTGTVPAAAKRSATRPAARP